MNSKAKYILMSMALLPALATSAQEAADTQFAIKATAEGGFGSALSTSSDLQGMTAKSSSADFSVEFGWTFWTQGQHSLEANIGLGYGHTSLTAGLPDLDYNYSAPAEADMDNVPYIRYYELSGLHQKISADRLTIPIYVNYRYQAHEIVAVHALLGFKPGFNVGSKATDTKGNVFSYGVYPQYDDLMIDASYMNEFGATTLNSSNALKPKASSATCSFIAGIGAEINIWGPISADITLRYEAGLTNTFKGTGVKETAFDATTAPVTYTVADGQKMRALSDYFTKSRLSRFGYGISLIYHF